MLRRSGFKRPTIERTRTVHTPVPEHLRRQVSYARADMGNPMAVEKPEVHRSTALREMAEGRPCLLLVPGVCTGNPETVVCCHSDFSIHGKAGARKADDQYSVWGCAACHTWLDQGPATHEEKLAAFLAAHRRQVDHWHRVASDPREKPRFRKAADWAINLLMRTE